MVKQKKMSKTSIAVIVLALLLVLSLIMGMTGAWFTDKQSNPQSNSANFGKIVVTATGNGVTNNIPQLRVHEEKKQLLPGDQFTVAAAQIASGADVDEYVYYTYEVSITAMGKAYDGSAWDATATERQLKAAVTEKGGSTLAFSNAGTAQEQLKIYEAGAHEDIATFNIVFNTAVSAEENQAGNFIYVGNVRYVVNKGTSYVPANGDIDISDSDVTITVTLKAYALQYDNIGYQALGGWLTEVGASATIKGAVDTDAKLTTWKGVAANKVAAV